MRAKPVNASEQYRLIMECRSSGLSDYQWCNAHDIKPGTFYNWVKRLRKKGTVSIPSAGKCTAAKKYEQDVVQIVLPQTTMQNSKTCHQTHFFSTYLTSLSWQ